MADQDGSYKLLFSHPRMVGDFLRGFVHEPWVEELDFSTLEKMNQSYVSDDLQGRQDDLVWRLRWQGKEAPGGWLYIYLVFEFQATVDPFMALRVLAYVALLYQDLLRRRELTSAGTLPPVLPVVLYNGRQPWRAEREVLRLIEAVPGGLEAYRPRLRYLLVDEGRLAEGRLGLPGNVTAALFRLERSRSAEELPGLVGALADWLGAAEDESLRRALATWLRRVLLPSRLPAARLPVGADLREVESMLEETVRDWTRQWEQEGVEKGLQRGLQKGLQKGRREGRQEGLREGEARLLVRLMERRFGPLDEAARVLIATADAEQLLLWGERILTARTAEEVFREE